MVDLDFFLLSLSCKYKGGQHLGKNSLRNRYMFNTASSYVLIVLLILVPRNSLTTQYCLSVGFFSVLASDIAINSLSVGLVYGV